jgi:hypothetical protein
MFKSISDMASIVKDVLFGMILLCFFVEIVKFAQIIPNILHKKLANPEQVEITLPYGKYLGWTVASYITVGAYWIAKLLYTLFIAILIATGAFVIIAGTMLTQRYLLNLFFIGLFGASSMPIIWFAINEGMKSFAQSDSKSLSNFFILAAGELLKIGIPVGGAAALFKNPLLGTTKEAASLPIKSANKVMNGISRQVNPASKGMKFLKAARGIKGISSLNKTQGNKNFQHKQNKAHFNSWLHDNAPPPEASNKMDLSKYSSRSVNQGTGVSSKPNSSVFKNDLSSSVGESSKGVIHDNKTQGIKKEILNTKNLSANDQSKTVKQSTLSSVDKNPILKTSDKKCQSQSNNIYTNKLVEKSIDRNIASQRSSFLNPKALNDHSSLKIKMTNSSSKQLEGINASNSINHHPLMSYKAKS